MTPITGMPLTTLDCSDAAAVSSLLPVQGMKLTNLVINGTKISDLSPLRGMPLDRLELKGSPISDLSPLAEMPLTVFWCPETQVTDFSALKNMPLKELVFDFKPERDSEIIRSIKTLAKINGKPAAEFWKEVEAQQKGKKP